MEYLLNHQFLNIFIHNENKGYLLLFSSYNTDNPGHDLVK